MADTTFVNATTTVPGTLVEAPWLNDVNTSTYSVLDTVVGTNAITANGPSTLSGAYPLGGIFRFLPATNNTGAVTININSIGVVAVTKYGTVPLVAGDLVVGSWAYVTYDGTRFQLVNPQIVDVAHGGTGATTAVQALVNLGATGRLLAVQAFPSTAVYTPTTGTARILIKLWGGGGAGGGAGVTAAGQVSLGGGGGAGGYSEAFIQSGFAGQTVTIGAAGVAMVGGAGGAGGTSTFMTVSSTGGGGGGISASAAVVAGASGTGGVGSGGFIGTVAEAGNIGAAAFANQIWVSGYGGSSTVGGGGTSQQSTGGATAGINGSGRASGGGGAVNGPGSAATGGGFGTAGFGIIYEYS